MTTRDTSTSANDERRAIHELVQNWAIWRDAGDWVRFRTCWHDDGRMMATWFQGTADEFIAVSKAGWDRGVAKMKVGDKVKLTIPPELAYGSAGSPPVIPANATLVFDITLLAVQ